MHKKANQRILGITPAQWLILFSMGGFLFCMVIVFGGYAIYALTRPIPVSAPPTLAAISVTQPVTSPAKTAQPTQTPTLIPKATARPTFTSIPTSTLFVIPTLGLPSATPTLTQTATPIKTATPVVDVRATAASLSGCEKTIYETYGFVLKYPAKWGCDKRDNLIKSTGPGGFMELTLKAVARPAKEYCETQVQDPHGQNRFGKSPTMKILLIDNRPACLIWPSSDQSAKYNNASLLVVEYPQSMQKDTLVLLTADKNHIYGFVNTLKFAR